MDIKRFLLYLDKTRNEIWRKKYEGNFWWDFYTSFFYSFLDRADHAIPFTYYISQSINSVQVEKWMKGNSHEISGILKWIKEFYSQERLVKMRCPKCQNEHWELESDANYLENFDENLLIKSSKEYYCPVCKQQSTEYIILEKSPREFLLQPNRTHPMATKDFEYWASVLRKHFPEHPTLNEPHREFCSEQENFEKWKDILIG